mmetsp:Transcript_25667/g.37313  ORF Transcript_25667/g.37313 Transcript_25667/m.37313 type:complete len:87 (+) Transcript_25667:1223-1483(+)
MEESKLRASSLITPVGGFVSASAATRVTVNVAISDTTALKRKNELGLILGNFMVMFGMCAWVSFCSSRVPLSVSSDLTYPILLFYV